MGAVLDEVRAPGTALLASGLRGSGETKVVEQHHEVRRAGVVKFGVGLQGIGNVIQHELKPTLDERRDRGPADVRGDPGTLPRDRPHRLQPRQEREATGSIPSHTRPEQRGLPIGSPAARSVQLGKPDDSPIRYVHDDVGPPSDAARRTIAISADRRSHGTLPETRHQPDDPQEERSCGGDLKHLPSEKVESETQQQRVRGVQAEKSRKHPGHSRQPAGDAVQRREPTHHDRRRDQPSDVSEQHVKLAPQRPDVGRVPRAANVQLLTLVSEHHGVLLGHPRDREWMPREQMRH